MNEHPSDHLAIYAAETAALETTPFERWIADVERLMGHDSDGDLREDGYSLDTFSEMFDQGLTPEQAAERIVGAVFVQPDKEILRIVEALGTETDGFENWYDEGGEVEG